MILLSRKWLHLSANVIKAQFISKILTTLIYVSLVKCSNFWHRISNKNNHQTFLYLQKFGQSYLFQNMNIHSLTSAAQKINKYVNFFIWHKIDTKTIQVSYPTITQLQNFKQSSFIPLHGVSFINWIHLSKNW